MLNLNWSWSLFLNMEWDLTINGKVSVFSFASWFTVGLIEIPLAVYSSEFKENRQRLRYDASWHSAVIENNKQIDKNTKTKHSDEQETHFSTDCRSPGLMPHECGVFLEDRGAGRDWKRVQGVFRHISSASSSSSWDSKKSRFWRVCTKMKLVINSKKSNKIVMRSLT